MHIVVCVYLSPTKFVVFASIRMSFPRSCKMERLKNRVRRWFTSRNENYKQIFKCQNEFIFIARRGRTHEHCCHHTLGEFRSILFVVRCAECESRKWNKFIRLYSIFSLTFRWLEPRRSPLSTQNARKQSPIRRQTLQFCANIASACACVRHTCQTRNAQCQQGVANVNSKIPNMDSILRAPIYFQSFDGRTDTGTFRNVPFSASIERTHFNGVGVLCPMAILHALQFDAIVCIVPRPYAKMG